MGGLRCGLGVGYGFASIPVIWTREGVRGDRGGELVRSKAVCALDGTGEDGPEAPAMRVRGL
jgi:hypothetical protein